MSVSSDQISYGKPKSTFTSVHRRHSSIPSISNQTLIDEAITQEGEAEAAVIHLAQRFGLDFDNLRAKVLEEDLQSMYSKMSYSVMAPRVHLDANAMVGDAPTFEVFRARITNQDFREIVQDIERVGNQYGPPADHGNESARSRYISAAFNHIVAWFQLMVYNRPDYFKSNNSGSATSQGLRNYFRCFGGCTILVMDIRLSIGHGKERLTLIAQFIAELEAAYVNNERQGFSVPILGVLCDGSNFEYFCYDGFSKTFSRGLLISKSKPGTTAQAKVTLPAITQATETEYIKALRPLCESFYYLLLKGFLAGVEAYIRRARDIGAVKGSRSYGSETDWQMAMAKAVFARNKATEAGEFAKEGRFEEADDSAAEAKELLQEGLGSIPHHYQRRVNLMPKFESMDIDAA